MKPIDRLAKYIEYKGISLNSFDKAIGAANGYIGKQIKNKGSIGVDTIEIIVSIYKDLSVDWLISGNGEMLLKPDEVNESPPHYEKIAYEVQERLIHTLQETIDIQQRYIKLLEKDLLSLKEEKQPVNDGQKREAG